MPLSQLLHTYGPEILERYNLTLRLMLAAALGGMIGLEREHSGKPAGFRTNMLICMGAALITEVSWMVAKNSHTDWGANADAGRIAAQIVSGIGFLGAGTILHNRGTVQGLTTAATLWVVAAIGMAVGARAYSAAIVGTTLVMLALMILGRVEDHLIPRRPADRNIDVTLRSPADTASIEKKLMASGFMVDTVSISRDREVVHACFHARGLAEKWDGAIEGVLAIEGVEKIELS
ncbi:MAG TPA: MgtC/SapB family protein [Longimicrobiales bacterium]|nr:MgtC/SapB family protein [Longimicrobiales bacterium]